MIWEPFRSCSPHIRKSSIRSTQEVRRMHGDPDGIAEGKNGYEVTTMMDVLTDKPGELKCMFIMGENPMISDPDLTHVEHALKSLEFLVCQDIFMNETSVLADVVLPATCYAEKDGTQTSTERRVQMWRKAQDPPGEARLDWQIIADIAKAMDTRNSLPGNQPKRSSPRWHHSLHPTPG